MNFLNLCQSSFKLLQALPINKYSILFLIHSFLRFILSFISIPIITFITGRKDNLTIPIIQTFYIKNIKMLPKIFTTSPKPHEHFNISNKSFSISSFISLSLLLFNISPSHHSPSLRGRKGNMNYIIQTNYFRTILRKKHILLFIYVLVCFISR